MTYPSPTAPNPENHNTTSSTIWTFLSAPIAGNASFFAGFLHWLAIAFKWFLNLILLVLAIGVMFGIGALIYGSLPSRSNSRGSESKGSGGRDAGLDMGLVELDFQGVQYDGDDTCASGSDDEAYI